MSVSKTRPDVSKNDPAIEKNAPRRLTLAENVVLTIKLLGGLGLVGAALWAVDLWTAAR